MASLFELCKDVPPQMVQIRRKNVLKERAVRSFGKRVEALQAEGDVFEKCRTRRPAQKHWRNNVWSEQMGHVEIRLTTRHASDGHEIVCRTKIF